MTSSAYADHLPLSSAMDSHQALETAPKLSVTTHHVATRIQRLNIECMVNVLATRSVNPQKSLSNARGQLMN
eukprot:4783270-Pleurochrysis_carterae.AAC.4